jgi:hypothetical protein
VEEVAWQFTGRWWMDNNNKNRDRVREYDRLRTLYGAYEDNSLWEINRPCLTVFGPDGHQITTVIEDPDGAQGPGPQTAFSKTQTLEAQIQAMTQQQARMEQQIQRLIELRQAEGQPEVPGDTAPAPQTPHRPNLGGGPPMVDLGAAGTVPVAPPVVQVPTMPEFPASAPANLPTPPESTDGVVEEEDGMLEEETYGERLSVTPEPIDTNTMPPVDEPRRTRIKAT